MLTLPRQYRTLILYKHRYRHVPYVNACVLMYTCILAQSFSQCCSVVMTSSGTCSGFVLFTIASVTSSSFVCPHSRRRRETSSLTLGFWKAGLAIYRSPMTRRARDVNNSLLRGSINIKAVWRVWAVDRSGRVARLESCPSGAQITPRHI